MTDAEQREAAKVATIAALEAGDTETAHREYAAMMAIKEKMESKESPIGISISPIGVLS